MTLALHSRGPSPSAAVRAALDFPMIDTDVHTND
jgi:hypothetical protein